MTISSIMIDSEMHVYVIQKWLICNGGRLENIWI